MKDVMNKVNIQLLRNHNFPRSCFQNMLIHIKQDLDVICTI